MSTGAGAHRLGVHGERSKRVVRAARMQLPREEVILAATESSCVVNRARALVTRARGENLPPSSNGLENGAHRLEAARDDTHRAFETAIQQSLSEERRAQSSGRAGAAAAAAQAADVL